jgi:hypothetical protein
MNRLLNQAPKQGRTLDFARGDAHFGRGDAQGGEGGCTCILCIPPGYAPAPKRRTDAVVFLFVSARMAVQLFEPLLLLIMNLCELIQEALTNFNWPRYKY